MSPSRAPYFELVLRVPLSPEKRDQVVEDALRLALEHDGSFFVRKAGFPVGKCRLCGSVAFVNEVGVNTCLDCGVLAAEEVSF